MSMKNNSSPRRRPTVAENSEAPLGNRPASAAQKTFAQTVIEMDDRPGTSSDAAMSSVHSTQVLLPPIAPTVSFNSGRAPPTRRDSYDTPRPKRAARAQQQPTLAASSPAPTVTTVASTATTTTSMQELKKEPRCLCGLCPVTVGTMILSIAEFLLICQTLIFAFSYWSSTPEKYKEYTPIFAAVVKYEYLMPFIIVNILWMISGVLLLVGVKSHIHPLLLPHIAFQGIIIVGGTLMTIVAIINIQDIDQLNATLVAALSLCILVTLAQVYLIYVVIKCFRYLKRLRLVTATEQQWMAGSWGSGMMSRLASAISRPNTVGPARQKSALEPAQVKRRLDAGLSPPRRRF